MSLITGFYLANVSIKTKNYSFKGIAVHLLGKIGGPIFEVFVFLLAFGGIIYYFMVVGELIPDLIQKSFGIYWWTRKEVILSIIMFLVIFPLSSLKDFNVLSYTSAVATFCAFFIVFFVSLRFIQKSMLFKVDWTHVTLIPSNYLEMFITFPILIFGFAYQISVPPQIETLENQNLIYPAIALNIFISLILYLIIGLFGYLTFFNQTKSNILLMYSLNDGLANFTKFIQGLLLVFSIPVFAHISRNSIESTFFNWNQTLIEDETSSQKYWKTFRFIAYSTIFSIIMLLFAIFSNIFKKSTFIVLSVNSSISATMSLLVFPSFLYAYQEESIWKKIIACGICFFTFIIGVLGLTSTIMDLLN